MAALGNNRKRVDKRMGMLQKTFAYLLNPSQPPLNTLLSSMLQLRNRFLKDHHSNNPLQKLVHAIAGV